MIDSRRLNKIFSCIGSLPSNPSKVGWSIVGYVGSRKNRERVYLEEDIEFESIEWHLSMWEVKVGVLWEVVRMNMNGAKTTNKCPSCGDDNERRFTAYLDGKYKPLDGHWVPYMSDFGGSGWIAIRCQKCGQIFNMDISS